MGIKSRYRDWLDIIMYTIACSSRIWQQQTFGNSINFYYHELSATFRLFSCIYINKYGHIWALRTISETNDATERASFQTTGMSDGK